MKVIVYTRYSRNGASSRLRFYNYRDIMLDYNIVLEMSPLFDDFYLKNLYEGKKKNYFRVFVSYFRRIVSLFSVKEYDLILIEKELFPNLPGIFESLLYWLDKPFIVDYDDAIYHHYDNNKNFFLRLLSKKIDKVMAKSILVICGNNYIEEHAKKSSARKTLLLPTVIDLKRYKIIKSTPNKKLIIGWIGTPSTVHCLEIIRNTLEKLCINYDFKLHVIGGNFESNLFDVKSIKWTEEKECTLINSFDIGIMPLHDRPFENGKCGYKLIQYMASVKPVIASPVGVNVKIINQSNGGYLAASDEEWEKAFIDLLSSSSLREKLGVNGRTHAEEFYSLQKKSSLFVKSITDLK
jgi:glycosyltransferase involved in cell wall biosynthesis